MTLNTGRYTLLATILGSSVAFIDMTVVNVALPSIQRDLGGGLAAQQWVVDAYLLTLGSLILVGGALADIFGEVRTFALGVAAFGVASALCAAAPDATSLIAFRGIQGVAGALLTPASLAVLTASFSGPERGVRRAVGARVLPHAVPPAVERGRPATSPATRATALLTPDAMPASPAIAAVGIAAAGGSERLSSDGFHRSAAIVGVLLGLGGLLGAAGIRNHRVRLGTS